MHVLISFASCYISVLILDPVFWFQALVKHKKFSPGNEIFFSSLSVSQADKLGCQKKGQWYYTTLLEEKIFLTVKI